MQLNSYTDTINSPDIKEDIKEIEKFDKEHIHPYIFDPFTFNTGILLADNSQVVGFGIIRVVNEIKLVLNPNLSNFNKARAIKLLLDNGIPLCQCNEIIAYITQGGNHYEGLLKKHYNFEYEPGTLLRLFR